MWRCLILSLSAFCASFIGGHAAAHADPVNARVGNISWVEANGREPSQSDSEADRIQTHLFWVLDRLGTADIAHLYPAAVERRLALLESLRTYAAARRFPRVDRPRRTPRFVDDRGVLCAVGHLIAQSGHPELVEAVQRGHEYDRIEAMGLPALSRWAQRHGFTIEELALIQPMYGIGPPVEARSPVRIRSRVTGATSALELALQRAIRQRMAPLRRCHDVRRRTAPSWFGPVFVQARVRVDGRLADVASPRSEDPFIGCLIHVLRTLRVVLVEGSELPVIRIALLFEPEANRRTQTELNRAALTGLLEEARASVEECVRRDHRTTEVMVYLVVRPVAPARLRSRTDPRSRTMEACVDEVLRRVDDRAHAEFRVEGPVRARGRWRSPSRATLRGALGAHALEALESVIAADTTVDLRSSAPTRVD